MTTLHQIAAATIPDNSPRIVEIDFTYTTDKITVTYQVQDDADSIPYPKRAITIPTGDFFDWVEENEINEEVVNYSDHTGSHIQRVDPIPCERFMQDCCTSDLIHEYLMEKGIIHLPYVPA